VLPGKRTPPPERRPRFSAATGPACSTHRPHGTALAMSASRCSGWLQMGPEGAVSRPEGAKSQQPVHRARAPGAPQSGPEIDPINESPARRRLRRRAPRSRSRRRCRPDNRRRPPGSVPAFALPIRAQKLRDGRSARPSQEMQLSTAALRFLLNLWLLRNLWGHRGGPVRRRGHRFVATLSCFSNFRLNSSFLYIFNCLNQAAGSKAGSI
jgi:hypothetical protein